MNNLEQAKEIFRTGEYSCVLYKDEIAHTSTKRGITPLVEWLTTEFDIKGFSAADKIVGKAAALLFVMGGLKEVYAPVMSKAAVDILSRHGIYTEYKTLVKTIINRNGTGPCPMEQAVSDIDDPAEALEAIQNTLAVLQLREKENRQASTRMK